MIDFGLIIRSGWSYAWGHLFAACFYDKRYLAGRWFSGPYHGLYATGWKWVCRDAVARMILRQNITARYPMSPQIRVVAPQNIDFDPDDLNNFQTMGCYFQAIERITIGKGTYIAPNVGIITANHDFDNLDVHDRAEPVTLGKACWIGMNSVILPGVTLGDHTIVGAGSVVTKSFPDGNCVIAGNPAQIIRKLDES